VIDEHAQAVLALLGAVTSPALTVYDGKVPSGIDPKATPYVLVYFAGGRPDLTFDGVTITYQLRATCHCVGGSAQAARMVADRVATALIDVTPTVTGRACWPIRWEDGLPPQRDETTGSLVFDQIDTYGFLSVPG
jgi:hypothetical protein